MRHEPVQSRLRMAAVVACATVAGLFAAGALAQDAADGTSDETRAAMERAALDAQRGDDYYEMLWGGALAKAKARSLEADVDQKDAERILSEALDPPADQKEAERLEDEMIALTAKLRDSGDLPALDDPTRFDAAGGPVGGEVSPNE